ncbi:hypothetical protein GCM10017056_52500 [Seohaeicola zhoushanensis]|uniref:Uncharacterized protein n=1 Tax=Seohaeicola zhoushanensis TaxID=1569283 RepID=A0A8J3MCK2_9RHOB|nr:hypothetical protein GCM10017056_52500 [Seohaeicola zhoushanensis]
MSRYPAPHLNEHRKVAQGRAARMPVPEIADRRGISVQFRGTAAMLELQRIERDGSRLHVTTEDAQRLFKLAEIFPEEVAMPSSQ